MNRYWEIDFARGVAVILMIIFHAIFDVFYFINGVFPPRVWKYLAIFTASLFIMISGISMTISYSRMYKKDVKSINKKYLMRAARFLFYGLIITALTFILFPHEFIFFGILHFFAVATLISFITLKINIKAKHYLALSFFSFFIGSLLSGIQNNWLFFLYPATSMTTFDYFPILPWIGVMFFGMAAGKVFYKEGRRCFEIPEPCNRFVNIFSFIGRHSLLIYFIHQPVLVAVVLSLPV